MMFMEVSRRLERWIKQEFAADSAERVLEELRTVPDVLGGSPDGAERRQASLVIRSSGDWYAVQHRLQAVRFDWRDALVAAGGDDDWKDRMDDVLGAER
jgi:plasmid stabilization system protein ParE